ncbi:M48 family metallopeptidase [Flavobacteriaceae bacterium]|nr:M48 family metallopeptidase [Flavobacteriaceae bacterium]MDB2427403.1 M48 family metallopeptidase [Flavobacteriaceae bacterium]
MEPSTLFNILITILLIKFVIDSVLNHLNAKHFNDTLPNDVSDVYEINEYQQSQSYKKINHNFSKITSLFSLITTLLFFFFNGFSIVDEIARGLSNNIIIITLIFFGIIIIGSDIISIPFSLYKTFVIEEKFGFNKSTKKLFFLDKIKGLLMTIILGGSILSIITWFYKFTGNYFWIYTWLLITTFSVFLNMFYSKLIVPLFNKQTILEEGDLKNQIVKYVNSVGFKANNIYVLNGSKRSTKANAYFSGFGNQKRITLYDTLINDLENDEIVAVLAHEVGHYKRKHILYNLTSSIILTGFALFVLSLFIKTPVLSLALGVTHPSFHIGLITFSILYSPVSQILGIFMNYMSRKFEYQADNYAKNTFSASPLISSLKKLSKNSLSNLTPHYLYVFFHFSHPTLLDRIKNLKK